MNERTRRMNEQKSPRGLFCEENRETGGQVLWTFKRVNRKADGKEVAGFKLQQKGNPFPTNRERVN